MVNIALIGLGIVGRNLVKIIQKNFKTYNDNYGIKLNLKMIFEIDGALIEDKELNLKEVLDSNDIRKLSSWNAGVNAMELIPNIGVDIIVEATPVNPKTAEPAISHIVSALNNGKHIITSNKGPFYLKYREIMDIASNNRVSVGFESTVGSAIPLLSMKEALAGNRIIKMAAILNGTSNYILSRMANEGINFDLALKEAQELGYAETDPTLDIEGYDAAGKLVILANHLMGMNKTIRDVKISGITSVNESMIELAKKDKKLIKHLAIAKNSGELEVSLKLIKTNSALALDGTLNGVFFETEHAGEIILTGRGAGGPEAAAGMISDILKIAQKYDL